jgi:hypothetical protein
MTDRYGMEQAPKIDRPTQRPESIYHGVREHLEYHKLTAKMIDLYTELPKDRHSYRWGMHPDTWDMIKKNLPENRIYDPRIDKTLLGIPIDLNTNTPRNVVEVKTMTEPTLKSLIAKWIKKLRRCKINESS